MYDLYLLQIMDMLQDVPEDIRRENIILTDTPTPQGLAQEASEKSRRRPKKSCRRRLVLQVHVIEFQGKMFLVCAFVCLGRPNDTA